jgi:hypothetical protein
LLERHQNDAEQPDELHGGISVDISKLINSDLDEDERKYIGPYLTSARPSNNEYRGYCVDCEDPATSKSPSASYNFVYGVWHCMSNGHGGAMGVLTKRLISEAGKSGKVIDIKTRKEVPAKPLPDQEELDGYVRALRQSPRLMDQLATQRMITPETISKFKLGWSSDQKRYVIPIYNRHNVLVNVRLYMINAKPPAPKMKPIQNGYHTQLFNDVVLNDHDEVVVTEGETDCMLLNQNGIAAVSHTGGANAFQVEWASEFRDKHVFLCFDEDDTGRKGMISTARMIAPVAKAVYIVIGLNTGKRGGDITDYFLNGNTANQFRALMDDVRDRPFSIDAADHIVPDKGKRVSLVQSQDGQDVQGPIEIDIMVSGKMTPPYQVPRVIEANCSQDKGKICAMCPMASFNGERTINIAQDDQRLLSFIDVNERSRKLLTAKLADALCSDKLEMHVVDIWNIEQLQVVQSLGGTSEEAMVPIDRLVFSVGTHATGCNMDYKIVCKQIPDPRNSRGVLHAWHIERIAADFERFKVTESIIDELSVFRPDGLQSPLDKCKEIVDDLAANVTRIYGRSMVHVAFDLVWHSALNFVFQGEPIGKGWLECLAMGDTRTGKSKIADNLMRHYHAGKKVSCEGATFAGLVGGLSQMGSAGYMTNWGVMANNDRRALFMDEMSGLMDSKGVTKGIIEQMSSIRSSGVAELTKIKQDQTSARTRLFWASNPVGGKTLKDTFGGATEAIRRMITNPEDIARFDFALAVSSADVPSSVINANHHEKRTNVYTSDLCSKLVLWAWSRTLEQIKFVGGAEEDITAASVDLGGRYVSDPPLVQPENVREKVARIAVAIAARTFSTDKTGEVIIVTPEHVESAVEFLDWIYGHDAMGYKRHSERTLSESVAAESNASEAKHTLQQEEFAGLLLALQSVRSSDSFRPRDFEEFGGVDPGQARELLQSWGMISRVASSPGRMSLSPVILRILDELDAER